MKKGRLFVQEKLLRCVVFQNMFQSRKNLKYRQKLKIILLFVQKTPEEDSNFKTNSLKNE